MLTQCVPRFNKIGTFRIPFTRFWLVSISKKIAFGKKIPEWQAGCYRVEENFYLSQVETR